MAKMDEILKKYSTLPDGEVILDVRSHDEYAEGHVPQSINIPHDQVAEHADELKKYSKIYIHCKMGGRAQKAFSALTEKGLNNLYCIDDSGMQHWLDMGYPTNKH